MNKNTPMTNTQTRLASAKAQARAAAQRAEVRSLIAMAGTNAVALSEQIGRGKDYLGDFLRGKKASISAAEFDDLRKIAEAMKAQRSAVPANTELGENGQFRERHDDKTAVKEFDLRGGASYGGGYAIQGNVEDAGEIAIKAEWLFPDTWLRGEMRLSSKMTDIIAIDGPSMLPDLTPGDRVLIDRSNRDPKQDAIFAIRDGDSIIVKHVQLIRNSDPPRIVCRSSNPKYEPFELILDGDQAEIIGRVAGRITKL